MKKKISISIEFLQLDFGDAKALEIAREIGADAVDFDLSDSAWDYRNPASVYSRSDEEIVAYFTGLREKAEQLGIEIGQTHGRLRTFVNDPAEDAAILENARRDCLATRALGAPYCVMHTITTGVMGPDAPAELMRELYVERFRPILQWAKEYGVKVATETFGDSPEHGCCDFYGNLQEFASMFEKIRAEDENGDHFCVCIDTGHSNKALRFGNPPAEDVIRRMGSSIACLHLNDNDTMTDQHKIPMTGTLDWDAIFDALDEVGYEGTYNMELNLRHFGDGFVVESAAFAVKVLRYMLTKRYGEI